MPSIQNLVLTDRQATPVAHTFAPSNTRGGVVTVAKADATGLPMSEMRYSISTRRVNGRIRTTANLSVPVLVTETINGVNRSVVARESYAKIEWNFSMESTETERNNVMGLLMSSCAPGAILVNDTVVKAQGIFGVL